MPFYLKVSETLPQIEGLRSVLIVPCRFCPAASLAVRNRTPYIEFFRRLFRTQAYESFIKILRRRLRNEGIRTAVFESRLLHQFVACMWTAKRRSRLAERAREFDGVVVLGCDAMAETVRASVDSSGCRVIQGMEIDGLMNVLPRVHPPFSISLELLGVTSLGRSGRRGTFMNGQGKVVPGVGAQPQEAKTASVVAGETAPRAHRGRLAAHPPDW